MLCLGRKVGEEILIGPDIRVIVYEVHGKYVKLAIDAPADTRILCGELVGRNSLPEDAIPALIKSPPRKWACFVCGVQRGPAARCYDLGRGRLGCGGCFDSEETRLRDWRRNDPPGPHPLGWEENRDNTAAPKGRADEI